ncbi:MAG: inner membrane CreD family protein [Verrucomicrobiota bacterium]
METPPAYLAPHDPTRPGYAAPAKPARVDRRNAVTIILLFIAGLILLLQVPLFFVNGLRQDRVENLARARAKREAPAQVQPPTRTSARSDVGSAELPTPEGTVFDGYRMVERSLKYGVFVLTLVFMAFFLFEVLAGLRLHFVHYSLVGAALCLFYLVLLAVSEVTTPEIAYVLAAISSSSLIVFYSAAVLKTWIRATLIAALLAAVHGVLFVILQQENYALLAGTGALFVALAGLMYFTRNIDWHGQDQSALATGGAK